MAVATSLAIAGLAATAAGTGMSFAQAGKQRKMQREAQSEADKAMSEARKKLEVNFYESLAIQKEPYELQREALLQQGAMGIEAGREGEARGAGATVGRVQMAQQEAQGQIRSAMGQELMGLQMATAEEESRLRDIGVQLDLEEVAGAQLAASNAQEAAAQAVQQGMQGITSMGQQLVSLAPLYSKNIPKAQLAAPNTGMTTQKAAEIKTALPKPNVGVDLPIKGTPFRRNAAGTVYLGTPTPTQIGYPQIPNYVPQLSSVNWADYLVPRR